MDLLKSYRGLSRPKDDQHYTAVPIEGFERHRVAKDFGEAPFVLISPAPGLNRSAPPAVALEHLRVMHDVPCLITYPDGSEEMGEFSIVGCTDADPALHEYFLRAMGALLPAIGPSPTTQQISQSMDRIVELFRLMSEPPRKSIQGLWAELFVIWRSVDISLLVQAWHRVPEDLFDFNSGSQRIEVKSAGGRQRVHHFRLEQLQPPAGTEVLVASMLVESSGAGLSLEELADGVRTRLGAKAELIDRFDRIFIASLGSEWRKAMELSFDQERARESLHFHWARDIPSIDPGIPPRISEVRFRVDLEGLPVAALADLRSRGGMFMAATGR